MHWVFFKDCTFFYFILLYSEVLQHTLWGEKFKHIWGFSILSRLNFYYIDHCFKDLCSYLSILSRFYFYLILKRLSFFPLIPFNPIKVLFLLSIAMTKRAKYFPFNPIKVLFLPNNPINEIINRVTFNPIKVLFLRSWWHQSTSLVISFQSYQGSIFT